MSEAAHVTEFQALTEFRAALCTFQKDAQDALATIEMEVRRAQDWLDGQIKFWRQAVHNCHEEVAEAKAALQSRKMFKLWDKPPDTSEQEEALARAERRLEHAEDRVETCRRWGPMLQRAIEEYEAPARRLGGYLDGELPRGLALLERMSAALERYAELKAPSANPSPGTTP